MAQTAIEAGLAPGAAALPAGAPPNAVPRVGVDLVAVARLERIMDGDRDDGGPDGGGLLAALFSPDELAGGTGAEYLAGRFAGKEAVAKVLGTGFSRGVGPLEIEILRGRLGAPRVRLTGTAAASAEAQGLGPIDLSISHTGGMAVCVAVAAAAPSHTLPKGLP